MILAGFVDQNEGEFKLVGEPFTEEPYGIGLKKGDTAFRTFINDVLEESYEDGSWAEGLGGHRRRGAGHAGAARGRPLLTHATGDGWAADAAAHPRVDHDEGAGGDPVDALLDNLPLIRDGFLTTLRLTLISAAFALVLGTVLGACRVSPVPTLRWFGTVYVELLRNTPLTLVFFFFVFVAPQVDIKLPFDMSALWRSPSTRRRSSARRCGPASTASGSGRPRPPEPIGLTFTQTMRQVVLPQALRTVVPPLINIFIALTKNTSIAVGFFVTELMAVGIRLASRNAADVVIILMGIAVCYLIITIPAGILAGRLERRVAFAR